MSGGGNGSGDFAFGSAIWPGIAKLIEECGEVAQVGGKLMQRGGSTKHWSGDLKLMLEDEIADVIAAAQVVLELNPLLDSYRVFDRVSMKMDRFRSWHEDNLGSPAA